MRAVVCRAWGAVDDLALEEVPAPTPGRGEVLIDVRATAVNYADALLVAGRRAALGSSLRYFRWHAPDKLHRSVEELPGWYAEGRLRPLVSRRLPLERTVEAIRLLTDRRAPGKVVVVPGE